MPQDARERADRTPVELRSGVGPQLLERGAVGEPVAVGPVRGHGVEGVGGQDDPRLERDLRAHEPVGVPAPVDVLVVMTDHAGLGIHAEAPQQALARDCVILDQLVLVGG